MSEDNVLEATKELNGRLTNLLSDPHLGLFTWHESVVNCLKNMSRLVENETNKKIRWDLLTCQEASQFSRETYIPCGASATSIIWHNKDRKAYAMCDMCADHNVKNRGGIVLAKKGIDE
jgi:hypothetical protein